MVRRAFVLLLMLLAGAPVLAGERIAATRTLPVGTILVRGDLSGPARGMIGLEVRRAIYAGHPVAMSDLGPPTLVHRNEVVRMHFRSAGIDLRAEGRALGAGGRGEVIEVMNLASRRTVRGAVTAVREVEVRR